MLPPLTIPSLISALRALMLAIALVAVSPVLTVQAGSGSSGHSDDDEGPEADDHDGDRDRDDRDDDDRDGDRDDDRDSDDDRDREKDRDAETAREQDADNDDDGRDDDSRDDDSRSGSEDGERDDGDRDDDNDKSDSDDKDGRERSSDARSGGERSNERKADNKADPVGAAGRSIIAAPAPVEPSAAAVVAPASGAGASEARAERAERLLEVIENKRGERVREGELLLISASKGVHRRLARNGFKVLEAFKMEGLGLQGYRVTPKSGLDAEASLARLRRVDPKGIASFNHIYSPARGGATIASPRADRRQPAAPMTSAKIGLVDAPVNASHPMLGTVEIEARAFGLANPTADNHGTAVASRLAEAAPGAKIYVASVFSELRDGEEVASVDAIARALDWLARNRIPVINMSLAGPPNQILEAVTARLVTRGHKLVAAVGNEGPNAEAQYPAAYEGVVGVTAVDRSNQVYIYANQGDYVDFAATGVDTTVAGPDGDTATVSGTSYAAPVVTAELARRLQRPDRALAARAEKELVQAATDLGKPGRDPVFGFGVVEPARQ